jgi:hypothetical protein
MPNGAHSNGQLAFTNFLFIVPAKDDEATCARLRAAGAHVARGFFNDFDADGGRDVQPQETIQFLVGEAVNDAAGGYQAARYAINVSGNYRPRLAGLEAELRRRVGDAAAIYALDGATRAPRYTSAEMHAYADKQACRRQGGRAAPHAIVLPMNKTPEWWEKTPLERHSYFYPHTDHASGCPVKGHAQAAEPGITTIFRRVFHNPEGYRRQDEFDFITYFECASEHLPVFDQICRALRDTRQNPEWKYVVEGPEWFGRRVLRW